MSLKIMAAVWEDQDTRGSERLVLLALADQANDQGYCWPSLETIAIKCNLKRRYVIDLVKALTEKGKIEREQRSENGLHTSTMYRVVVRRDTPRSEEERTTVVRNSSPPSEADLTTGSEAERTRVVRPASLKPSFNRQLEPSNKTSSRAAEPAADDLDAHETELSRMQALYERLTGYPSTPADEKAIEESIRLGVIERDIAAAIAWRTENGKLSYGAKSLLGTVRVEVAKRVQAQAAANAAANAPPEITSNGSRASPRANGRKNAGVLERAKQEALERRNGKRA